MGEPVILGRIHSDSWWTRPETYRDEVRSWLRSNGVNPNVIPAPGADVEIVLMDAPCIVRDEYVLDSEGRKRREGIELAIRRVHSLCRVPLPVHLNELTDVECGRAVMAGHPEVVSDAALKRAYDAYTAEADRRGLPLPFAHLRTERQTPERPEDAS